MKFTEAQAHFVAAFSRDPGTPPPPVRLDTLDDFHDWKAELRAYDSAKIELNLATAQQIQAQNAAVRLPQGGARIIRHTRYV